MKKKRRTIFLLVIIILILLLLRLCTGSRKAEVDVPQPPTASIQEKTDTFAVVVNPVDSVVPDIVEVTMPSVSVPRPARVSSEAKIVRVTVADKVETETSEVKPTVAEENPAIAEENLAAAEEEPTVTEPESQEAEEAEAPAVESTGAVESRLFRNAIGVVFTPDIYGNSPMTSIQWKHFVNARNSVDIRAGYQINWGPEISALFEWNFPVKESGFRFYAGPGVHIGLITNYTGNRDSCIGLGLAGAAGFEYLFPGRRFALSLDWHPYLTWQPSVDNTAWLGWNSFQIGAKYCF